MKEELKEMTTDELCELLEITKRELGHPDEYGHDAYSINQLTSQKNIIYEAIRQRLVSLHMT